MSSNKDTQKKESLINIILRSMKDVFVYSSITFGLLFFTSFTLNKFNIINNIHEIIGKFFVISFMLFILISVVIIFKTAVQDTGKM